MYQTSQLKPADLKKIKIKHQDRIKEVTGEELDPVKAWQIIKSESKNFTLDHAKAREADGLFAELVQANGLMVSAASRDEEKERIRVRERERARAIEIMKLKLQIAA